MPDGNGSMIGTSRKSREEVIKAKMGWDGAFPDFILVWSG
jgi:hypothetical protein